jgi:hypothetical protein
VGCQDHISAQVESRNVQGGFKTAIQVAWASGVICVKDESNNVTSPWLLEKQPPAVVIPWWSRERFGKQGK